MPPLIATMHYASSAIYPLGDTKTYLGPIYSDPAYSGYDYVQL